MLMTPRKAYSAMRSGFRSDTLAHVSWLCIVVGIPHWDLHEAVSRRTDADVPDLP